MSRFYIENGLVEVGRHFERDVIEQIFRNSNRFLYICCSGYHSRYYNHSSGYSSSYSSSGYSLRSGIISLISIIFVIVIIVIIATALSRTKRNNELNRVQQPDADIVQTIPKRSKITSLKGFDPNCMIDECGWADNVNTIGSNLKTFYDRTGIQPYVLFKSYDNDIVTESKRHDWADRYFVETLGNNPTAVLLVYFCEADENDDGWCELIIGDEAGTFVDAEATDIFWEYFDDEWYSSASTDKVVVNIFNRFADACLK